MKPLITIGIPCFNQAQYLPDALESILSQDTHDVEIIVVNDASPDHTKEIAKRYPVKLVNHRKNKGLAEARNTAIKRMTGEWFFPLDADDMLMEGSLEKIRYAISITPANISVLAPSLKEFGISNNFIILNNFTTAEMMVANRIGYFSLIRKSVLDELGGYNPNMKWGWEDWDLWLKILEADKAIGIVQEPLVLYRTKENSMIHEANRHADELREQLHKNHPKLWPVSA